MLDAAVIVTVFVLVFLAELPDKTAVAGLVLGTRFPWRWVFAGIAAAFLTHVCIAVAAGSLLTLLPRRAVESVVAALFLVGAVLVWREGREEPGAALSEGGEEPGDESSDGASERSGDALAETSDGASAPSSDEGAHESRAVVSPSAAPRPGSATAAPRQAGFFRVAALGYGVIFVAEWGDLTQILTANLAAKYHDPVSVGVGAVLGLWAVGLLAILGGRTLLRFLPIKSITRVAAVIMLAFAVYSVTQLID